MAKQKRITLNPIPRAIIEAQARSLFTQARAIITASIELLDAYEDVGDQIRALGYAEDEYGFPFPDALFLTTGNMNVDDASFLDEWFERGPSEQPLPMEPSVARRSLAAERQRLGVETSWTCFYCRKIGAEQLGPDGRLWHVDHVYPLVLGGDDQPDNHVLSCATCNLQKHALTAMDHFSRLASD